MNHTHLSWIAIIVSIMVAAGGISYGVIQGQYKEDLDRLEVHEIAIEELKIQTALIKQELAFMNLNIAEIKDILKHQDE